MTDSCVVYVSCSKGDCIEVLALDRASGELTSIETVALPGNGMPLAIAPDKRHLYAAVAASNHAAGPKYVAFQIDQMSGKLEQRSIVEAPGRMSHIAVDRSGRHLLGASVSNDLISSHGLEPDGRVRCYPTEVRMVPSKAHQITTDLTNSYAFVPNLGADLVLQLTFDEDSGRFSDNTPAELAQPAGASPRHIAYHPNGRFAYLLNEENGTIAAFALDATSGTLMQFQTSDFLPANFDAKPWGAQILVTPDGRYIYSSERASSTICLHALDPDTGRMNKRESFATEACPRNFTIDPSGRFLIAGGEKSNRVACYRIDAGSGDLVLQSTIDSGAGPLWVEALEQQAQSVDH